MQVVSLKVYVFICGQFIPPTKDGWDFLPKSLNWVASGRGKNEVKMDHLLYAHRPKSFF